jgi:serine/threonine protein kinase
MVQAPLVCNNCGAANQPQASYCRSCGHSLQSAKPTLYHSETGRLLPNVLLKGRYRILTPVGKGGMGAVYEAEDTLLGDRHVAIKEMSQNGLNPQELAEAADIFKQEAVMLAHLQHPNLPSIFDHFEESGRWYLVMSFIPGESLARYLKHSPDGKMALEEMLAIGIQLCTVLDYLHSQNPPIIFRDLKPSNIMRMPDGHVYLIDFGIARHFKPDQSRDTAYYGSMGYAPPEQYGRAQTTPRSDIYSLGVTMHELLSGHDPSLSPFRFPLLSSLDPTLPISLAALVNQMQDLEEEKRPANMLVVRQELQKLMYTSLQLPLASRPDTINSLYLAKRGDLLTILKGFQPRNDLYVLPTIPEKKLNNGRKSCEVPEKEEILALIDGTLFGSAADCVLFGVTGMYYHDFLESPGYLPYIYFPQYTFTYKGSKVYLNERAFLNQMGSSISSEVIFLILERIKALF